MIKKLLLVMVLVGLVYGFGFGSDHYVVYDVDTVHSSVSFAVSHMVVSKTRGEFTDYAVTIKEDPENITMSSVTAVIKTASIDTRNESRDKHLRSADFFDVEKFPEITFKSKKIEKKGDGFVAHGTLTMHGVSKEISLAFTVSEKITDPYGNIRVGIETSCTLDRRDYGLKWNRTLDKGGLVVGNEVKIEIMLEMIAKK
jgi:polyisoprenoid-binding protein YceI